MDSNTAADIVPGIGADIPEPEAEGFRAQAIKDEDARRAAEAETAATRSADTKAFYKGVEGPDDAAGATLADTAPTDETPRVAPQ